MALSATPVRIDIYDDEKGGPLNVDVHYAIDTNNAEAVALGAKRRGFVVKCECPRARVATMLSFCQIVNDGGWPEGLIALPLPRKP